MKITTNNARRVTFLIWDVGDGGAQRVMVHLANYWSGRGWQIQILCLKGASINPAFELARDVTVTGLDAESIARKAFPKTGLLSILLAIRRAIQKTRPDVVIGFMEQPSIFAVLSLFGTRIPVIATEHCDPNVRPLEKHWERWRKFAYGRAAAVVAQTEEALNYFSPRIRSHGRVISNPVVPFKGRAVASSTMKRPALVSMGRLEKIKGFDRLIDAFAQIASSVPEWSVYIWGEGTERNALEAQIESLGLVGRVFLPGFTAQPHAILEASDLFVVTSRSESWSMVLCEAMSCGVPVISFDCPSGPRHIIRHNEDGMLVADGDVAALGRTMAELMTHSEHRHRLSARGPEVLDRFSLQRVAAIWEELMDTIRA